MKKFDVNSWVRENIRELQPYSSARDEFTGEDYTFLDANENPFETGLNRYPDPYQSDLKKRIADMKGCLPEQLFLGNGSDEAIDLLIRCFAEPRKDRLLAIDPSYGMYKVCADINGIKFDTVLLEEDFSLNPNLLLDKIYPETKIIFLCSPNNPSGNILDTDSVITVLENYPGPVVIDEAYRDFSNETGFIDLLGEYQNLIVLQTFSKAWGMAGVRLGMAMADPSIISYLNKVKYPYNINQLSQDFIFQAIDKKDIVNRQIEIIKTERERLVSELKEMPGIIKIFPSEANFILIRVNNAKSVYKSLLEQGIVVRDRSSMSRCKGCLRITVGTPEENDKVIRALGELF